MSMNLYILRHGIAVEPGTPGYEKDADRPLTPEGEHKLLQIAKAMDALDLSFDVILSSPYVRARQTADSNPKKLVNLLTHLQPLPEKVLLVGHEPFLSGLISLLVFGQVTLAVVMKKGGLCKLSTGALKTGRCASLEWLLTPKQMALMG